ncbi:MULTISPECIES: HNH endonuclease [Yersinia]|jgi:putative restriction endonuclease|uniref:Putative restriction endonuclease n=1 Tax=Yersinia intermedia TaxID=631 RepID=A0A0T9N4S8_YERIN|nr:MULTISPECIES: HNH endonuclease [Yersinia]ARB83696.1 HNH endonuclease [Yersinia sp. FDAARGOS_228]AVL37478.1 HNH endonuclease [Yersinia intermedia]MDA5482959.1 HNH endonuclease [Yersinia intermedia]CNC84971.1 putative restriction endonuclease [Yersinia intermedia]CNG77380.1 putative restriction endonuclease [Yersinia intermedia]
MAAVNHWTRDQLLVAFTLYSQIPFGKLHSRNPDIIHYAALIGRTPSALAMKLVNLASLDPFITDSGRSGLTSVSKADRALWLELNENADVFELQCQQAMRQLDEPVTQLFDSNVKIDNGIKADIGIKDFSGGERTTIIKARVGQQLFRKNVLHIYDNRCCITELEVPALLVASHIRPWSHGAEHRLNPSNGLCLSSLHDRAFDQGLITFNEHLEMVLSPLIKKLKSSISEDNFAKYEGRKLRLPVKFSPDEGQMAYHRQNIFIK